MTRHVSIISIYGHGSVSCSSTWCMMVDRRWLGDHRCFHNALWDTLSAHPVVTASRVPPCVLSPQLSPPSLWVHSVHVLPSQCVFFLFIPVTAFWLFGLFVSSWTVLGCLLWVSPSTAFVCLWIGTIKWSLTWLRLLGFLCLHLASKLRSLSNTVVMTIGNLTKLTLTLRFLMSTDSWVDSTTAVGEGEH